MDIEQRLAQARAKAEKVQQLKARAEVERDNATRAKEEALSELKETFGVDSVEEAMTLLNSLKTQLDESIDSLDKELAEF